MQAIRRRPGERVNEHDSEKKRRLPEPSGSSAAVERKIDKLL